MYLKLSVKRKVLKELNEPVESYMYRSSRHEYFHDEMKLTGT